MAPFDLNSMQAQAGLSPPQVMWPGQVSALIAATGSVGSFGSLYPSATYQTALGQPQVFQGPTGLMAPMTPSAPFNPYAAANPYASLGAFGGMQGRASPFAPYAPNPPPAYGGFQGTLAVPFAPPPAFPAFDTPYGGMRSQFDAAAQRDWMGSQAMAGVGARAAADLAASALGAMIGRRFGSGGAVLGAGAGFAASEYSGFGQGAQNLYGNWFTTPALATQGMGAHIHHRSRGFVSGGSFLDPSGQGFSHHAALDAAQELSGMAASPSFRQETRNRFNQQDVFRITSTSMDAGLLTGVNNPQALASRVREVARSLSAFMELAKEPDVVRAIQTMGSLRSGGLNLTQTMNAVQQGRLFARMAGTSFSGLAEMGGALGSQTFASMGLTEGLGFQVGMGAFGQAASSVNSGILNPQLAALVGGSRGLATLNTMSQGAMLQLPMFTPGVMGGAGGLSAGAVQNLLSGRTDLFGLTGQGSNALSGLANRYGTGGLGMAVAMQPLLQNALGQVIQSAGPFAGRNLHDQQILALSRQLGMSGSQGYLLAAQAMGMERSQALSRATELGSGAYWETQQRQLGASRREALSDALERREAASPGIYERIRDTTSLGGTIMGAQHWLHSAGVNLSRAFGGEEFWDYQYAPQTDQERRAVRRTLHSREFQDALRSERRSNYDSAGGIGALTMSYRTTRAEGIGAIGAWAAIPYDLGTTSAEERRARYRDYVEGERFSGNFLGATARDRRSASLNATQLFGGAQGMDAFASNLRHLNNDLSPGLGSAAINLGVNVAGNHLSRGFVDTGNLLITPAVRGNQIRDAYMRALTTQGITDPRTREQMWANNQAGIAAGAARVADVEGWTEAERESLTTSTGLNLAAVPNERRTQLQESENTAYRSLMGNVGREGAAGLQSLLGQAEGIGREGTAEHDRTRRIVALLAAGRLAGSAMRERTSAVRRELTAGMSDAQRTQVEDMAIRLGRSLEGNQGAVIAAQGLFGQTGNGATLLSNLATNERTVREGFARRQLGQGFAALSRNGGILGSVLSGVNEDTDYETIEQKLREMTPEQRRQLSREGSGGARIAAMLAQGNYGGVQDVALDLGQHQSDLQRQYERENSGATRAIMTGSQLAGYGVRSLAYAFTGGLFGGSLDERYGGRISNTVSGWGQGLSRRLRDRWVQGQLRTDDPTVRGLGDAARDSAAARSEAEGAGIGRAGDALLEASRELRATSQLLRDTFGTGRIPGLVERD